MRNKPIQFAIPLLAILLAPTTIQAQPLTTVSAASYQSPIAPNSMAAIFGANFTTTSATAQFDETGQLPTSLGGLSVDIGGRPPAYSRSLRPKSIASSRPKQYRARSA